MGTKLAEVFPPEITLPAIVRAARIDFTDYRALTFSEETLGGKIFSAVAEAFGNIVDASTREAVNGAVYKYAQWCAGFDEEVACVLKERASSQAIGKASAQSAGPTRAQIEAEITRLKEWIRAIDSLMQILLDEKADIEDLHQQEFKRRRYEILQSETARLAEFKAPVENNLTKLEHYLRSLSIIERGLPIGVLGQALEKLPDLSTPMIEETPTTVVTEHSSSIEHSPFAPELRKQLDALAHVHGIEMPIYALVYSLFDIFNQDNRMGGPRNRGLTRVLRVANDAGILPAYGWASAEDALQGSSWKGQHDKYLKFCGNPAGFSSATFSRTVTQLPWDSGSLVTNEQRKKFMDLLSQRS